jgi:hypothetical protein
MTWTDCLQRPLIYDASIMRAIVLMIEVVRTSETSVNFYQTTRRNNPDDSHPLPHTLLPAICLKACFGNCTVFSVCISILKKLYPSSTRPGCEDGFVVMTLLRRQASYYVPLLRAVNIALYSWKSVPWDRGDLMLQSRVGYQQFMTKLSKKGRSCEFYPQFVLSLWLVRDLKCSRW